MSYPYPISFNYNSSEESGTSSGIFTPNVYQIERSSGTTFPLATHPGSFNNISIGPTKRSAWDFVTKEVIVWLDMESFNSTVTSSTIQITLTANSGWGTQKLDVIESPLPKGDNSTEDVTWGTNDVIFTTFGGYAPSGGCKTWTELSATTLITSNNLPTSGSSTLNLSNSSITTYFNNATGNSNNKGLILSISANGREYTIDDIKIYLNTSP